MHTVEDLMTTKVTSVQENDSVGAARDLMHTQHLHAVPVLDRSGVLVGIVTSFDLLEPWSPLMGINSVMSPDVVTVGLHTSVTDAARTMVERSVHHLVVSQRNVVLGIVSSFDVMRHLAGRVDHLSSTSGAAIRAVVGDTLVVRPRNAGDRERRATIVAVHGDNDTAPYTVRWSDDQHDEPHLTLYTPSNDAYVEHSTTSR